MQKSFQETRKRLKEVGIENPALEARWIFKHVFHVSDADLIGGTGRELKPAETEKLGSILRRRISGEPLSRVLGERQFRGLDFVINGDVLDPRPDTEIIIETALKLFHVKHPVSIIDLGTGSGCILASLLKEFPGSTGVGVDLSLNALKIARINAERHGIANRMQLICGNWAESINGRFDLVVCNPPYIATGIIPNLAPGVRNHDPILALDGGADGLDAYKNIFPRLRDILKPGGRGLFEIGFDQKDAVERLSIESRIRIEAVHADLGGHPRIVEIACGDK